MKRLLIAICVTTQGMVVAGPALAQWTGNANVVLGAKSLDEDDWEPVEDQGEIAVHVDFRPVEWPVNLVVDLSVSAAEDSKREDVPGFGTVKLEAEAATAEWNLGVRKIWEQFPHVRPFVGGGLALIRADVELKALGMKDDDDDTGVGYWFGGGVYWTLAEHFNLGFDFRYSYAQVTLFDDDMNAGGGHFGFMAGYHW